MKERTLICMEEERRDEIRAKDEDWNGLDYVEVEERVDKTREKSTWLATYFVNRAPASVLKENVVIPGITVKEIDIEPAPDKTKDDIMWVKVDLPGASSVYTLHLVAINDQKQPIQDEDSAGVKHYRPFPGFDPRYASVSFRFLKAETSHFDCRSHPLVCPPEPLAEPELDYLAKDYASFRRLIYDRLAFIMPDWRERHIPDIGVALVELLAYTGDHLSQYQDAVATEAYLHTARLRTSVRRHARLVDYRLHEGCNARVWVHVQTNMDFEEMLQPGELRFGTGPDAQQPDGHGRLLATSSAPTALGEVFEPLLGPEAQTIHLYHAHNEIHFYTWGDTLCCLPRGATSATLIDDRQHYSASVEQADVLRDEEDEEAEEQGAHDDRRLLQLQKGDYLLFEEVIGPRTGKPADADPTRRHIVRLTQVEKGFDALYDVPVLEIAWAKEDGLPFPLCISTLDTPEHDCRRLENVSVARGNMILADHGRTLKIENLGTVPLINTAQTCLGEGELSESMRLPGKFEPTLHQKSLAFAQPVHPTRSTQALLAQDPRAALPCIELWSIPPLPDNTGPLFTTSDLDDPTELIAALHRHGHPHAGHLYAYLSRRTLWLLRTLRESELLPEQRSKLHDTLHTNARQMRPRREPKANAPLSELWQVNLRESLRQDLRRLLRKWEPRFDLIVSRPTDRHFMVEVDNEGQAHVRFGDGQSGRQPEPGEAFVARYRLGGGPAGNVGAGAISCAALHPPVYGLTLIPRNPWPASGGTAPELLAEAKQNAAHLLHTRLERAVTAEDYAAIVMRDFKGEVQKAAATITPDGGWRQVEVAVDPLHRREASAHLRGRIEEHLQRYRRAGHFSVGVASNGSKLAEYLHITVKGAEYVPLDITFQVTVRPGYLLRHVEAELRDLFSNRLLGNGRKGFFHPDNLSFGDDIYLSRLIAVAQAVPGVENVRVTNLLRYSETGVPDDGVMQIDPLAIARLDNDPEFPENGRLTFEMEGGR